MQDSILPSTLRYAKVAPVIYSFLPYKLHASGAFCLALLFCVLFPATAVCSPSNFVFGKPMLQNTDGVLTLSLPLSVDNEDAFSDLLRDGASIELNIKVNIERKRGLWFNEKISTTEFSSLIKHDPLNREFRMSNSDNEHNEHDASLRALLSRSWKALQIPLIDENDLKEKQNYIVKIELSLKHTALPPWLDRTLVFWSKDVVNPERLELNYKVEDAAVYR